MSFSISLAYHLAPWKIAINPHLYIYLSMMGIYQLNGAIPFQCISMVRISHGIATMMQLGLQMGKKPSGYD